MPIVVTAREFALLEVFMRRSGQVLSQRQLLDAVRDFAFDPQSNVVEVYVRYSVEKVDRPFGLRTLQTVRGMGYRLCADDPA